MAQALLEVVHISETLISDHHKEAYGFRPSHLKEWWTPGEVEDYHRELSDICEAEARAERAWEEHNLDKMEVKIGEIIAMGAGDRQTALRWILEAEGDDFYDASSFSYEAGLPYSFGLEIERLGMRKSD